jgi:hypothetical protein
MLDHYNPDACADAMFAPTPLTDDEIANAERHARYDADLADDIITLEAALAGIRNDDVRIMLDGVLHDAREMQR